MRAGSAGSNTAADHIEVLSDAITQIPRGRRMDYSVRFNITQQVRDANDLLPSSAWTPATDADGGAREGGDVAVRALRRW